MLQTSYGSLTVGLDAQPGQSILIRGGTSSIGLATAVLAKRQDMTVFSTTRSAEKTAALSALGADYVLIDDGDVAAQVRTIVTAGVDTALELVCTATLPDTLPAIRVHGVVCFTGMLSNKWIVKDFYPIAYLPRGVRLTAYSGDATDLPAQVLQDYLDAGRRRPRHCPDRPCLRVRPDRRSAHSDGTWPCDRKARRHHLTQPVPADSHV